MPLAAASATSARGRACRIAQQPETGDQLAGHPPAFFIGANPLLLADRLPPGFAVRASRLRIHGRLRADRRRGQPILAGRWRRSRLLPGGSIRGATTHEHDEHAEGGEQGEPGAGTGDGLARTPVANATPGVPGPASWSGLRWKVPAHVPVPRAWNGCHPGWRPGIGACAGAAGDGRPRASCSGSPASRQASMPPRYQWTLRKPMWMARSAAL